MAKGKSGKRYKNGRLQQPTTLSGRTKRDYGNEFVQRRRALFDAMCIKGGKAVDQVFDGIGQLWALDFLDGHHLDPELMRDTARKYGELYWTRNSATAPKSGKLERGDRAKAALIDSRADLCMERWLDDLTGYDKHVLEHCVVDYWFSDGTAGFVNRLVSTELLKRGRMPQFLEMEVANDREMLAALLRALFVLVDGALPARFERKAA
jgi:hypothetical protein